MRTVRTQRDGAVTRGQPEGGRSRTHAETPADDDDFGAILWDLDDTLFDHAGTARRALRVVRREFPELARRSVDEVQRDYLALVNHFHLQVLRGELSATEARTRRFVRLLELAGARPDPRVGRRMAELYRETYERERRAVPGAVAILRHFSRRAVQGVVSNNPPEEQAEKLRAVGLDRYVRFVVTSQEVGVPKPHPAIFRAALDRADASPARAVMVGDSWAYDVLGARAAGMRAVWFNPRALPMPDPTLASELRSLRPLRASTPVVLGRSAPTRPRTDRRRE